MPIAIHSKQPVAYACLEAKIIRKNGRVEDQGIIAEYKRETGIKALWKGLLNLFNK